METFEKNKNKKKIKKGSGSKERFRSSDLWVMGPTRFPCATLLANFLTDSTRSTRTLFNPHLPIRNSTVFCLFYFDKLCHSELHACDNLNSSHFPFILTISPSSKDYVILCLRKQFFPLFAATHQDLTFLQSLFFFFFTCHHHFSTDFETVKQ